jgi:hypothetical protein
LGVAGGWRGGKGLPYIERERGQWLWERGQWLCERGSAAGPPAPV